MKEQTQLSQNELKHLDYLRKNKIANNLRMTPTYNKRLGEEDFFSICLNEKFFKTIEQVLKFELELECLTNIFNQTNYFSKNILN